MKVQVGRAILMAALAGWGAVAQGTPRDGAPAPPSQRNASGLIRPAAVPPDYVITPFGYFHPSCVRLVNEGETVLQDERIRHADGSVDPIAPVCNYPRFAPDGSLVSPETTRPPTSPPPGWVEYISATTRTSFGKLTATWTTPPQPATSDIQMLYFFPGFADTISGGYCILQPVLQYGTSPLGGGNYWSIASWNVCGDNIVDHSMLITVSAGDTLLGSITSNCKPGGNSCATWNVTAEDENTGAKATMDKTTNDKEVWNWAFASVLETYNVFECTEYPANNGVSFDVNVYDQNLQVIANPGWTKAPVAGVTPYCDFGLGSTGTINTVTYNPNAPTSINVTGQWYDTYQMTWTLSQAQKSYMITGSVSIGPEFSCQDSTWPVSGQVTSGTNQFTITATNPVNGSDGCYLWYTYTLQRTSTIDASGTWVTSAGTSGTVSLTLQ
jgi:hypothetical protein